MFKASIKVVLKRGVLDPQARAILQALQDLGHDEAVSLSQGKYIELCLSCKDKQSAEATVQNACNTLLVNSVIETYTFDIECIDDTPSE